MLILLSITEVLMGNGLIVKHNEIIEGKYNMSITEVKIIAKLTSVIQKEDDDFKRYMFKASDILKELNMGDDNYAALKESIDKLVVRKIELRQESSTLTTTFLSSAEYFENSMIELEFSPKLKPYLLQLKNNFTKYYLEDILTLKSFYAVRIYEILKQYEKIKERTISIDDLKEMLKVTEKSYNLYSNFKAKVLAISEREINEKTDLNISYEEIKSGKKVTSIKFHISKKDDSSTKEPKTKDKSYSDDVVKLYNLLPETERIESRLRTLEKMLVEHTYEYIYADIEYCKTRRVKDFFAYLVKSVKNGHYSSADIEKKKKKESVKEAKKKIAEEKKLEEERRSEERKNRAEMRYNSLSEEEIESYKKKSGYYNIPEKIRKSVSAEDMIMVVLMEEEN